jgi:hypothetical protein
LLSIVLLNADPLPYCENVPAIHSLQPASSRAVEIGQVFVILDRITHHTVRKQKQENKREEQQDAAR